MPDTISTKQNYTIHKLNAIKHKLCFELYSNIPGDLSDLDYNLLVGMIANDLTTNWTKSLAEEKKKNDGLY